MIECDELLEFGLLACGWAPDGSAAWVLATPYATGRLVEGPDRAGCRRFELRGPSAPRTTREQLLADNSRLVGPVKFTSEPLGVVCRADVPWQSTSPSKGDVEGGGARSWEAWARSITRCFSGSPVAAPVSPDLDAALHEIQAAGWSASIDEGRLLIHVQLPGAFRQARLEPRADGARLSVDLVDGAGAPPDSWRAMLRLAQAVNTRLILARLAVDEHDHPSVLRAEVHWGEVPVLGDWLTAAMAVVTAATALVAREFEALRDPELAQLVLAATAAHKEGERHVRYRSHNDA